MWTYTYPILKEPNTKIFVRRKKKFVSHEKFLVAYKFFLVAYKFFRAPGKTRKKHSAQALWGCAECVGWGEGLYSSITLVLSSMVLMSSESSMLSSMKPSFREASTVFDL